MLKTTAFNTRQLEVYCYYAGVVMLSLVMCVTFLQRMIQTNCFHKLNLLFNYRYKEYYKLSLKRVINFFQKIYIYYLILL